MITHSRADHTGFVKRLTRETGAPVFVHEADRESLTRILQLPWWGLLSNAWRPYVCGMLWHATLNGVFTMPRVLKPRTFKHGDVLEVPGRPRVIHTPGHTPGEVSLLLTESKILLTGDTLATRNVMAGEDGPPQIMPPALTGDYVMAQKSLDQLRELGRVKLLPGHGPASEGDMEEVVEFALNACRRS